MGVATGCGCKEVYRFPHITYPYSSCICSFLQRHPYFLFFFKMFFVLVLLIFYYMHNNNNCQCKMCWNKALTFGVVQYNSVFVPLCSPNTCKDVFNPNVTTFQSNCAKGLHFSAFHYYYYFIVFLLKSIRALCS